MNPAPVLFIKKGRETPFVNGHPWVFSGAIVGFPQTLKDGDVVEVQTKERQFVAWGLYNSKSQISVRLYSWNKDVVLDDDFWISQIREAVSIRKNTLGFLKAGHACRLIYSEADGLSGLTVDAYDGILAMQFTSLAMYQRKDLLIKTLKEAVSPRAIYLRTEKGIRDAEGLNAEDGLVWGEIPEGPVQIKEGDLQFHVDVRTGHKTGFYLDQRQNRLAILPFVKDKKVLDLFCYTGGFSVTAAKGGAAHVMGVDSSAPSLLIAQDNAKLNDVKVEFEKGDAFEVLEKLAQSQSQFDVVILDPPKFARSKSGIRSALDGYVRLNKEALKVLKPGGVLVTCSCSGHVSRDTFANILSSVSIQSGRTLRILEERGQASDHPVKPTCPENAYLKCFICVVS